MTRRSLLYVVLLLALAAGAAHADAVTAWNDEAIASIKATKTFVAPASRALAMTHLAIFDAVNGIDERYQPYRFITPAPAGASDEAAAAVAGYRVLSALFPERQARLEQTLRLLLEPIPEGGAKVAGIAYGYAAADAMLAWRANDHATDTLAYVANKAPGHWQPTPPAYGPPIYLQWSNLTPFTMKSDSQFRPTPPPAINSEAFAQAFNEIKAIGGKNSTVRTPEQSEIATFWADPVGTDTTAGRWNLIAQQVVARRGYSLVQEARLFALLNAAMADAAIVAWDCKVFGDYWRPVTAIRAAEQANNPGITADPTWESYITTPSFPEYMSGHATFGGAAATVLGAELGDANDFTVTSYLPPTIERRYHRFSEAAMEGAMSRLYGGIHYRFSSMMGLQCGQDLGKYVEASFLGPKVAGEVAKG